MEPCWGPSGCCSPEVMECRGDPWNGDFTRKCHQKAFEVDVIGVGVDDMELLKDLTNSEPKPLEIELSNKTTSIEPTIKDQNEKNSSASETLKGT